MNRASVALAAWKEADRHARDSEARLQEAWKKFEAGEGEPPQIYLLEEVSHLRAIANQRLTALTETLKKDD